MYLALRSLATALLVLAPFAASEEGPHLQAGGMTLGWNQGVAGVQWDNEGAIGVRYWRNATAGDEAALVLTTCVSTDSHLVYYCEWHAVAP